MADALENTQIEIVQEVDGKCDEQIALNVTEYMLGWNPDIDRSSKPGEAETLCIRGLLCKIDDTRAYTFHGRTSLWGGEAEDD